MFLKVAANFILLHAGTPVEVSQTALTIMFVVLGIALIGIGFGRLSKTKPGILQHRWLLTVSVALTLGVIFLVMLPSAFSFYIAPDLQFISALSITTLVHAAIGLPAVVTALIYVFGDLPVGVKKWMRIAATLWVAALALGVVLFLQMLSLI